jgi:hypothetical protein
MMRTKGINPKKWFYQLKKRLNTKGRLRTVLAGAACEQWINSELFCTISDALTSNQELTVYPEHNKNDMAIIKVNNGNTHIHFAQY